MQLFARDILLYFMIFVISTNFLLGIFAERNYFWNKNRVYGAENMLGRER